MIMYSLQLDADQWIIPYFSRTSINYFERRTLVRRRFTVRPNFCRLQLIYQIWTNGISRLVELQPNMEVNHQNWALNLVAENLEIKEIPFYLFHETYQELFVCSTDPPVRMIFRIFVVPKYGISADKHSSKPCWALMSADCFCHCCGQSVYWSAVYLLPVIFTRGLPLPNLSKTAVIISRR